MPGQRKLFEIDRPLQHTEAMNFSLRARQDKYLHSFFEAESRLVVPKLLGAMSQAPKGVNENFVSDPSFQEMSSCYDPT
jgi:hypothetical protein